MKITVTTTATKLSALMETALAGSVAAARLTKANKAAEEGAGFYEVTLKNLDATNAVFIENGQLAATVASGFRIETNGGEETVKVESLDDLSVIAAAGTPDVRILVC